MQHASQPLKLCLQTLPAPAQKLAYMTTRTPTACCCTGYATTLEQIAARSKHGARAAAASVCGIRRRRVMMEADWGWGGRCGGLILNSFSIKGAILQLLLLLLLLLLQCGIHFADQEEEKEEEEVKVGGACRLCPVCVHVPLKLSPSIFLHCRVVFMGW